MTKPATKTPKLKRNSSFRLVLFTCFKKKLVFMHP